jgi:hypothetical protein
MIKKRKATGTKLKHNLVSYIMDSLNLPKLYDEMKLPMIVSEEAIIGKFGEMIGKKLLKDNNVTEVIHILDKYGYKFEYVEGEGFKSIPKKTVKRRKKTLSGGPKREETGDRSDPYFEEFKVRRIRNLEDIKDQMLALLEHAGEYIDMYAPKDVASQARSMWMAHVEMALTKDHGYLGGCDPCMEDTIQAMKGGEEDEDA